MIRLNYKRHIEKDNCKSVQFYKTVNLYSILPFYHPDFTNTFLVQCDKTNIIKRFYGDLVYDILFKRNTK